MPKAKPTAAPKKPPRFRLTADHPLAEAIEEFLSDMEAREASRHTLRAYRGDLTSLASVHDGPADTITKTTLRGWRTGMTGAPSTRARRQAAVRSFLAWCVRHEFADTDPGAILDPIKVPPAVPRPAAPAAVTAILAAIPKSELRDRSLFGLIATTGARVMEAAHVDIEDIHIDGSDRNVVLHGKGGKTRVVFLDDERYVGGGLTYARIQVLWHKYRTAAGHPDIEIHQLRHSYGTALAADGISVTTIRAQLGHANLTTSQGYIDFTAADAEAELRERARRRRR